PFAVRPAGRAAGGARRADQGCRPRGRLSRGDPARRLLPDRSATLFRPTAEILRGDRTRLPDAVARRGGGDPLPRALRQALRRVSDQPCISADSLSKYFVTSAMFSLN